jgi:hypothetical protein
MLYLLKRDEPRYSRFFYISSILTRLDLYYLSNIIFDNNKLYNDEKNSGSLATPTFEPIATSHVSSLKRRFLDFNLKVY